MLIYVKSHVGLVREINEDSYLSEPPHLFAIADGMGGHVAGEVASQLAVESLSQSMQDFSEPGLLLQDRLTHAVRIANLKIYELAIQKQQLSGMGTTLTACFIENNTVFWAHVGDSRLYKLHEGRLEQITQDHSLVGELLRIGSITPEEAFVHPKRNILTQAVGTNKSLQVDSGSMDWQPGDLLLLCTDGLSGLVPQHEIVEILQSEHSLEAKGDRLIEQALSAGGTDNITAILLQHLPEQIGEPK